MAEQVITYTPEQLALYRRTYAPNASMDEVEAAAEMSKRVGLDLFSGFINLIPKFDRDLGYKVHKPAVSIDGFRVLAERSGKYRGQTPVQWCGADEVWKDVWISDKPPMASRVGVHHADYKEPIYAVAVYRSYVQTYVKDDQRLVGPMWIKMPDLLLGKCAEALALRKAFPERLAKVYTPEEMAQANNDTPETSDGPEPSLAQSLGLSAADIAEAQDANRPASTAESQPAAASDAPPPPPRRGQQQPAARPAPRPDPNPAPATDAQLGKIYRTWAHLGASRDDLFDLAHKAVGDDTREFGWNEEKSWITGLSKKEASSLIDRLGAIQEQRTRQQRSA